MGEISADPFVELLKLGILVVATSDRKHTESDSKISLDYSKNHLQQSCRSI